MTTILDQEKFSTLKALAEVQTNLSLGQAELLKLKETTEEYMVVRETEAEDRVLGVLQKSRVALEETTKNHNELTSYARELKAYANELHVRTTDTMTLFEDFHKRMQSAEVDMDSNHELVSNILRNIKTERIHVTEDRKMLERERKQTNDESRLLVDRRAMLERGFAELKKLKEKTI